MLNSGPINAKAINAAGGKGRVLHCRASAICRAAGIAFTSIALAGAGQSVCHATGVANGHRIMQGAASGAVHYKATAIASTALTGQVSGHCNAIASAWAGVKYGGRGSLNYGYTGTANGLVYSWRAETSATYRGAAWASLQLAGSAGTKAHFEGHANAQKRIGAAAETMARYIGHADGARVFNCFACISSGHYQTSARASMLLNGHGQTHWRYWGAVGGEMSSVIFRWAEGVAYRVVQDPTLKGLRQGGIKRDAIMSKVQRLGL